MQQLSPGQQELVMRRNEECLCILMNSPGYDVSVFDFVLDCSIQYSTVDTVRQSALTQLTLRLINTHHPPSTPQRNRPLFLSKLFFSAYKPDRTN